MQSESNSYTMYGFRTTVIIVAQYTTGASSHSYDLNSYEILCCNH